MHLVTLAVSLGRFLPIRGTCAIMPSLEARLARVNRVDGADC